MKTKTVLLIVGIYLISVGAVGILARMPIKGFSGVEFSLTLAIIIGAFALSGVWALSTRGK